MYKTSYSIVVMFAVFALLGKADPGIYAPQENLRRFRSLETLLPPLLEEPVVRPSKVALLEFFTRASKDNTDRRVNASFCIDQIPEHWTRDHVCVFLSKQRAFPRFISCISEGTQVVWELKTFPSPFPLPAGYKGVLMAHSLFGISYFRHWPVLQEVLGEMDPDIMSGYVEAIGHPV
ncbi:MAG: hypothetical protein LBJ70_05395 [Holosporales bacterium]|jgi:hypothetical protein|nr:hypothetical protein [Holosporales bacterium]